MVKLLVGEENYILDSNIEAELEGIEMPEMNVTVFNDEYDIKEVEQICFTSPFLADRKVVIVRVRELKSDEGLKKLVKEVPDSTTLLLCCTKINSRSSIASMLSKNTVKCGKPDLSRVVELIAKVAAKEGVRVDRAAAEEMVKRVGYYDDPDVNLYSVIGTTRQLAMSGNITLALVSSMLPESTAGKAWNLLNLVCKKKAEEVFSLLTYLLDSGEQPIGFLSLLLNGFKNAWRDKAGIGVGQRFQYAAALEYSENSLLNAQECIEDAIELLKKGGDDKVTTSIFITKLMNLLEK